MTLTVPASASSEPAGPTPPVPRQLWQAPLFLLGIIALLAAWLLRPCASSGSRYVESELKSARQKLSRADCDLAAVDELLQSLREQADQFPRHLGELHLLLGTVRLRQADRAGTESKTALYQAARQELEDAERRGVRSTRAQAELKYRLVKAAYHLGDNPQRVVERLADAVEGADDIEKADAYNLFSYAYLQLPQPDLRAALAANEKLRQDIPRVPEEVLGPARLLGGKLLLQLGRPEEARKALERVGSQAPADVQLQARLLRARSFQDEHRWAEAAPLWLNALGDTALAPGDRADALYHLGHCYRHAGQLTEAMQAWEECARVQPGDCLQAAAIVQAELHVQENRYEKALDVLAQAVKAVARPDDWKNRLVSLEKVREVFERVAQSFRKAGRFDLAAQLAGHFERVAAPGRPAQIQAEINADWARARRLDARKSSDADVQAREEAAANELFCKAGAAYIKTAATAGDPDAQADQLWLALACYREAPDFLKTLEVLDKFLPLNANAARAGEAWYVLGETLRHEKNQAEADKAFRRCIQLSTPFAFRARYQLARAAKERGNLDEAKDILQENLKMLAQDNDPEAQEQTLFLLGDLLYQRRGYREVARYLEEALGRYPANPGVTRARFQLADSYRQLAVKANQDYMESNKAEMRKHFQEEYRRWLRKAADEYLELAQLLDKPEARGHMSPDETIQVWFYAAECRFFLGRYDEALKLYEELAQRYRDRPQGLNALGCCVRCHWALRQNDKVRQRLDEIRTALALMDGDTKAEWERWLREVMKQPTTGQ